MEVEQIERDVKATIHCIGLFLPSDAVGPCLIMMTHHTQSSIYCVSLTKETADMVSPLYEHTVLLRPLLRDSCLHHFVDESSFTVTDRRAAVFRVVGQFTKKELEKKLITLLGCTLFIPMDRCYSSQPEPNPLMKPFFSESWQKQQSYAFFDCVNNESDSAVLLEYLDIYKEATKKKYRGKKTLYENYWKELNKRMEKQHAQPVSRAVLENLTTYVNGNALFEKVGEITLLFKNNWKQYKAINNYFVYRTQGMDETYALYKMLKYCPEMMTCLYGLSYENRVHLHTFCILLRRLISNASQNPITLTRQDFPQPLSFFDEVLKGHLYTLMGTFIGQHQPEEEQGSITEVIMHPLISFCLMLKLEAQAYIKALYSKATLEPIVVQNVYTAFHSLCTAGGKPATPIPADQTFELDASLVVEIDDFQDVLISLVETVKREATTPTSKMPNTGFFFAQKKPSVVKAGTPLFYYSPDTENLKLEEQNEMLCDKYLLGSANVELYVHSKKPILEDAWRDDWYDFKETTNGEVQQINVVLFSATEMKENKDLECLKTLLFADLYNTVILREITDVFFHNRLAHYFAENQTELTMSAFHSNFCFETALFGAIPKKAIKETILIPMAGNLSIIAMKHIIQLIVYYQKTIKRIVFIGSTSMIPLAEHSIAFIDLLRVLTPKATAPSLYNKEERASEFATLLNTCWRQIKCDSYQHLASAQQNQITHPRGDEKCILYHIKKQEFLFDHLPQQEASMHKHPLIVFCLFKTSMGTTRGKGKNWLFESLNSKQKASNTFQSMEIDALSRHDRIGKDNSLFVISRKTLFQLDKNEMLHLFSLLHCLYVTDDGEVGENEKKSKNVKTLIECLIESFAAIPRPNLRYSNIVLNK